MIDQPLSVNEVLRHIQHDFLNQLQLIKMNLALDHVEEVNQLVDQLSTKYQRFSIINGLKCAHLIEWLQTCQWRFPSITITMESDISDSAPAEWDVPLRNYLESSLQSVHETIDPFVEQNCHIYVMSTKQKVEVAVEMKGYFEKSDFSIPIQSEDLSVIHEEYSDTVWRYRVIGSKEGK
ncbi:Spo0B domain-containing protein [Kurthia gibsonii]|uniref:Spo0B domain-containing protein n=1 Tax=Kurthia gibsonii TaxID=33946 RepID=UPI0034CD9001